MSTDTARTAPAAGPTSPASVAERPRPAEGFHDGELAVQRRAGVTAEAARLSGMLAPGELRGGISRFLADRTFAVLTGRDQHGRLWTSPVTGRPGFLDPTAVTTLTVHTTPVAGDPLHGLPVGQPVGLVVVEFATRRRVRINGTLAAAGEGTLQIAVEQAYGNCPQYIQQRTLQLEATPAHDPVAPERRSSLTAEDDEIIRAADTFFVGTHHPTRGTDASHRGGPPGFVRIDSGRLWWPDYSGNNMFNTLGNLAVDSSAALLFADFTTGRTLQLSGTAAVDWTPHDVPGDDDGTGRRVHFTPESVVAGRLLPLHAAATAAYPYNPQLTD
ncbi:pyridoxamine 5'-phosphate oxidase family protein [uncultured Arthrobacter sp.]|uniref:pyridoxamine 5'-phosphate oxidase family protein n=1 Tax=uncultured Arthrobacter sp. TaxID=114050 RepID=UPI0026007D17|nr:pyridoxamine 5'-phosphate oxidase family protein [uncultured Arthrobacter sp.]